MAEFMVVTETEMKFFKYMNGESGPFNKALFETIFHADVCNLQALKQAFPEEVRVVNRHKNERHYFKNLTKCIREL